MKKVMPFLLGFLIFLGAFFVFPEIVEAQGSQTGFINATDNPGAVGQATGSQMSDSAYFRVIFNFFLGFLPILLPIVLLISVLALKKKEEYKKNFVASYVGFWKRVLIGIIDGIVLFLAEMITNLLASSHYEVPIYAYVPVILYVIINVVLYFSRGQTLADTMMGTKLVDAVTGETPRAGKLIGRFFGKIVSVFTFGVGYWMGGWNPEKQAFHDAISGTRYVGKSSVHKQGENMGTNMKYPRWIFVVGVVTIPLVLVLFSFMNSFAF